MTNYEIFAQRFRELRIKKGINQEKIGELLNISKASISRYEKGSHIPEIEKLIEVSKFFNVSIDYLLGTVDHPDKEIIYNISKELRSLGIDYITVIDKMKNEGMTPEKILKIMEFAKLFNK